MKKAADFGLVFKEHLYAQKRRIIQNYIKALQWHKNN